MSAAAFWQSVRFMLCEIFVIGCGLAGACGLTAMAYGLTGGHP